MEEFLKKQLESFENAYYRLVEVLENYDPLGLDIALDATIQRFEFTFEPAWKSVQRFTKILGFEECKSPRGCIKLAYKLGWIEDQDKWLKLLEARNLTSHTYDAAVARRVYGLVKENHRAFAALIEKLKGILEEINP